MRSKGEQGESESERLPASSSSLATRALGSRFTTTSSCSRLEHATTLDKLATAPQANLDPPRPCRRRERSSAASSLNFRLDAGPATALRALRAPRSGMSLLRRVRLLVVSSLGASRSSPPSSHAHPRPSCALTLLRATVAYLAFLASLTYEPVQNSLIYLHGLRFPYGTDFSRPELVGFAPGKVRPFNLTTHDGARLGAWQVLPRNLYEAAIARYGVPEEGPLPDVVFDQALLCVTLSLAERAHASRRSCMDADSSLHARSNSTTVLYFHGNAGTRAAGNRVRVARHMSDMDASFLILDYRNFADSSRTPPPSEEGLITDARRAWDWLVVDKGVEPGQVAVMGQSLGTGVSAGLVARLADEGVAPRALVLVAPFSSIPTLLETYRLGASLSSSLLDRLDPLRALQLTLLDLTGNLIPILSPLRHFPRLLDSLLALLKTRFDTHAIIHKVTCPTLILHAHNDPVIPLGHTRKLAERLLVPLLAPHAESGDEAAREARKAIVRERKVGGWGVVSRFERGEGLGEVVWAEVRCSFPPSLARSLPPSLPAPPLPCHRRRPCDDVLTLSPSSRRPSRARTTRSARASSRSS